MEINKENIEELILLFVDGEIPEKEGRTLMDFIRRHPEYDSLLKSYAATKLDTEDELVFPDKALLIREENKIIPFYKKGGLIARIAAILVLGIVGIAFLWKQDEAPEQLQPVAVQQVQPSAGWQKAPEDLTGKRGVRNQVAAASLPVPKQQSTRTVARLPQQSQTVKQEAAYDARAKQKEIMEQAILPQTLVQQQNREPSAESKEEQPELLSRSDSLEPAPIAKAANKESLRIPDWMPLDQDRLQGVNDLVAQIQATREKVEERVAILKHSTLVLQVWNKEIVFGNRNE